MLKNEEENAARCSSVYSSIRTGFFSSCTRNGRNLTIFLFGLRFFLREQLAALCPHRRTPFSFIPSICEVDCRVWELIEICFLVDFKG